MSAMDVKTKDLSPCFDFELYKQINEHLLIKLLIELLNLHTESF